MEGLKELAKDANPAAAEAANDARETTQKAELPKEMDKLPAIGGLFKAGIAVLFCDGSVRLVRNDPPVAVFRAAVTPRGNEAVDLDKLDP